MVECAATVKKTGLKCKNTAKFGDLCGVHNNSKKTEEKKSKIVTRQDKNLDKYEKYVKKMNKNKIDSFERNLSHNQSLLYCQKEKR
jgi:hypothetical protein